MVMSGDDGDGDEDGGGDSHDDDESFSSSFQAPPSMKSCVQAAWLLTVAFGNLIVVIVAESHFIKSQVRFLKIFFCTRTCKSIFK